MASAGTAASWQALTPPMSLALVNPSIDEMTFRTSVQRRSTAAVILRAAFCVLATTPLLRWAVLYHSVPAGEPWLRTCPRCAVSIGPHGDLRGLSPLARCGNCRHSLGPPPWTLEAATVVSFAAFVWRGLTWLPLAAYLCWAATGVVLAFVDLAVQRLPTRLSYTAAFGLLLPLLAHAQLSHDWQPWIRAALGSLITAAVTAAGTLTMPTMVHWGDVRYALAVGAAAAWAGWLALYVGIFLATLMAALVGLALLALRRASLTTQLPLGPFLYTGTLVAVMLLPPL
jgi:leader peptidase (prepilin peptidase)/N-methyltransferase